MEVHHYDLHARHDLIVNGLRMAWSGNDVRRGRPIKRCSCCRHKDRANPRAAATATARAVALSILLASSVSKAISSPPPPASARYPHLRPPYPRIFSTPGPTPSPRSHRRQTKTVPTLPRQVSTHQDLRIYIV
jgi:hypothetical protein